MFCLVNLQDWSSSEEGYSKKKLASCRDKAHRSAAKLQTGHGAIIRELHSFQFQHCGVYPLFHPDNTCSTEAISGIGNFYESHTHSRNYMVTTQGQQEETMVFPDRRNQQTLPWGVMVSHHLRQKQSCWHYDFGVTLNFIMSSLFCCIPSEEQLHTLRFSGFSHWQGCTCHPTPSCSSHTAKASKLWSFHTTGPSPPQTRSSDAAKTTQGMSWCPLTMWYAKGRALSLTPEFPTLCQGHRHPKAVLKEEPKVHHPLPSNELSLGTAQVSPAKKQAPTLPPADCFYKRIMLISRTIAAFRVQMLSMA